MTRHSVSYRLFLASGFMMLLYCCDSQSPPINGQAEGVPFSEGQRDHVSAAAGNPFMRSETSIKKERLANTCIELRMTPPSVGETDGSLSISNRCDFAVAVLTSPLELRVRETEEEKFVYERMPWTAYGLLYVVSTKAGKNPFRGDGVARDGGPRLFRPPKYATVGAKSTVVLPVRCDMLSSLDGRYGLHLATYAIYQGEAPSMTSGFDCKESVTRHNQDKGEEVRVSLPSDALPVESDTVMWEIAPNL
jgi:hypothetical protein